MSNKNIFLSSSGVGIAVIVIVCVGFLIFIIALGVVRIRSAQQRSVEVNVEEKQEMEWDNSALTITVNPLDREVGKILTVTFNAHDNKDNTDHNGQPSRS